jgi:hypothetical protein
MSHRTQQNEQRAGATAARRRHAAEAVIAAYLRDLSGRRRAARPALAATR